MSPVQVALWNGIVMGGGVGLSVHAPLRVATERSLYAMPETAIGFFCDVGGSYFLSRVHGNSAYGLFLGITGHRLRGRDLLAWDVATHYTDAERLPELRDGLVKLSNGKRPSLKEVSAFLSEHCESSTDLPVANSKEIEYCFREDSLVATK